LRATTPHTVHERTSQRLRLASSKARQLKALPVCVFNRVIFVSVLRGGIDQPKGVTPRMRLRQPEPGSSSQAFSLCLFCFTFTLSRTQKKKTQLLLEAAVMVAGSSGQAPRWLCGQKET
jgi:hypothetical protein